MKKVTIITVLFLLLFAKGCNEKAMKVDVSHYSTEDITAHLSLLDYPPEGYPIKNLFVHCTASREGLNLSLDWFLDFFRNDRGWNRPGYHFLILLDGTIEVMWPNNLDPYLTQDEVVNGARGHNFESIHISYVGGVDRYLRPKDTRTPEQKRSIDKLIQTITCKIPNIRVRGHREVNGGKACPSFEVQDEYGYLNPQVNTGELFDYFIDTTKTMDHDTL